MDRSALLGSYGSLTPHTSFSFLDIGPLARGHSLVIPKCASRTSIIRVTTRLTAVAFHLLVGHGEKLHDVPDEYLKDSLIVAKKIAVASGLENYNILQVSDHPRPPHYLPLIHLNRPE